MTWKPARPFLLVGEGAVPRCPECGKTMQRIRVGRQRATVMACFSSRCLHRSVASPTFWVSGLRGELTRVPALETDWKAEQARIERAGL